MGRGHRWCGVRRLAPERSVTWAGCVDTWSPDSRYVASEVKVDGAARILVADVATGDGRLVTPEGVVAHCPLWSPDSRSIAFAEETPSGSRVLAIIGADGTALRSVSGDLAGFAVDGPDTWSPDGKWIYFSAGRSGAGRVYRANAIDGASAQLTPDTVVALAPASSPDGTQLVYLVARSDGGGVDLYVANSDGGQARRILEHALNDGWSADGRYVLTRWTPPDQPGGLAVIAPDGSGLRVVAPFDQGCPADTSKVCDIGWGQPRP